MKNSIIPMTLLITLFLTSCGPKNVAPPDTAKPAVSQKEADIVLLPESGQETARLLLLLERVGEKTQATAGDDYYYATGVSISRDQNSAIEQAYQGAVASLAGKVSIEIRHDDLEKILEKTDETVTQSGSFWRAAVKVRVAKTKIAALSPDTSVSQKPKTEVAAGVLTDGDFYYIYGSSSSKDMQFARDKARHDANVRLAYYLGGSDEVEITITGSQMMTQSLAQRNKLYLAEVIMKAPVALNKRKSDAGSTADASSQASQ